MGELKVLCSIAARAGSKGIPGKNLKMLGGKPLIAHAIESALSASKIDKVVINTEDDGIAAAGENYGAIAPFRREEALADDDTPLLMTTKDTMLQMDKLGYEADVIIQLAATCPFIRPETLNDSVELALQHHCAVSLKRIEHEHPYRAKELAEDLTFQSFIKDVDVEAFQSRQSLPTLYCTSGGIYTRTRELLMTATDKDFCLGKTPKGIVVADVESINIDRPVDFEFAEFIINSEHSNK